jgi:hypothetical protein
VSTCPASKLVTISKRCLLNSPLQWIQLLIIIALNEYWQQVSCYTTEYYCAIFFWLLSQENLLSDTDAAYVAISVACVWKSKRIAVGLKSGTKENHNECTKITRWTYFSVSQMTRKFYWVSTVYHMMGFSRFYPYNC